MRSANSTMKPTGSIPCHIMWLGSQLNPNAGRRPIASRARRQVPVVVGDLTAMHLVGEPDAILVERVEDWTPTAGEILVPRVDHVGRHWREHRHVGPDPRAGEAGDDLDAELACNLRGERVPP